MPATCPHGHTRGIACPHCLGIDPWSLLHEARQENLELQAINSALRDQIVASNHRIVELEAEQQSRWN